jgi:peroxiredoxin
MGSGVSLVKPVKLPHFVLKNDIGAVLDSNDLNARLNVLIFFTLEDCPACLYEAEFWGEAAQVFSRSDVGFWGITTEKDRNRIQEFISEYQISFPIFMDKDGKLKEKILSTDTALKMAIATPFKVFVNRNREIIRIEGPKKDVEEQKLFLEIISNILSGK